MERHPDLLGEGWDPRGVVLAKGRWEEGWGPRDGSSLETHLRSRAQGQDQEPSPGSHLTVRVKAGPSPLTMPSSARPEPMLIMVGMMSNFPACQDREKEKKCFCRGRERPLVPAGSDGGEPVAASYLPKHDDVEADAVGLDERALLLASRVSVVLGKPEEKEDGSGEMAGAGPWALGEDVRVELAWANGPLCWLNRCWSSSGPLLAEVGCASRKTRGP